MRTDKMSREKALEELEKIKKNCDKLDKRAEGELRLDMMKAWRRLAFRIMVYLTANPDILAANNNQEIYDHVRKIQIAYYKKDTPDKTDEEIGSTVDFLVELRIKHDDGNDYFVEQETMELYRPNAVRDKEWEIKTYIEMFFYATMPEIYTKTVHELSLNEEETDEVEE